jgi:outer membrane lipopolysaccharide assembly protein LptE/RlpB
MKIIFFSLSLFVLSACTNQIKENQELINEIRSLEIEISGIYGSAGYKFGQAMEYLDGKDYNEAEKWLVDLQKSFPEWNKEFVAATLKKIRNAKN